MLPRIQAQELLDAAKASGLAFGSYERRDAERMLRDLHEKAGGKREKPRKATPAVLGMMGIGVIEVPSQKSMSHG